MTYLGIISNGPSGKVTAPQLLSGRRPQVVIAVNALAADYACDWWVMADWWPFTQTEPLLYEGRQPVLVGRRQWIREMDAASVPRWQAWPRFYLEDVAPAIPPPDVEMPCVHHRHGNSLGMVTWDGFSGRAALGVAYWLCRREQCMRDGFRALDVVLCGYDNGGTDGAHDLDPKRANRTDRRWAEERMVFDFFMRAFEKIGVKVERLS